MKRRIFSSLTLLLVLAIIAFGIAFWLNRPTPGVTLENAHRVFYTMTLEEVEELFGEPGVHPGGHGFNGFSRVWKKGNLEIEVLFYYGIVDPKTNEAGTCSLLFHFVGQCDMWDSIELPEDDRFPAKLRRLFVRWF